LPQRFILQVALLYPGKNISNLLKAFKLVRQREDIKLVVAGTPRRPYYTSYLKMIGELGLDHAVFLPGYIPHKDLIGVYNLASMVVHPSFYESFPAIPLEAMACGCPVVISHTGGSPEAAGGAARYVDPWNVEDIADGIRDVLTNSRLARELVQRGFAQAQRFSWYEVAQKTLQIFDEISRNHFGNLK
jgi:glycosyltransferase involved in cell wall biosynthesis